MNNPSPIAHEYMEHGRSASCPIIDMHGHLGTFAGAWLPSTTAERMIQRMERCGIQFIVSSHHMALSYDPERGNALMQETIDKYPDHFLGYWLVNPNYPDTIERELARFDQTRGFVGLKLWPDYHLIPVTSPVYGPLLDFANARNLIVMVHTFGESPYDGPALLGEVAGKYPNVDFLMAHSGYGEWETSVAVARDLPNVYLDITSVAQRLEFRLMPGGSFMSKAVQGSGPVAGLIEYMVKTAGSPKVVFGSDLPWYSQHYHAGAVLFSRITDEARHDILHRNAERLLGAHLRRVRRCC